MGTAESKMLRLKERAELKRLETVSAKYHTMSIPVQLWDGDSLIRPDGVPHKEKETPETETYIDPRLRFFRQCFHARVTYQPTRTQFSPDVTLTYRREKSMTSLRAIVSTGKENKCNFRNINKY
ncbi:unnamed protein product [Heligmosomoides polygyrus]|uniref:Cilia- and flagella-associated protein 299 n=1 Tax=Heligmosomoides polygyrus TaxID=6339 RepID=A0A3P7Z5J9_HELPZ|nr:unnamed protein product [Heligmosomoides polygyrus]